MIAPREVSRSFLIVASCLAPSSRGGGQVRREFTRHVAQIIAAAVRHQDGIAVMAVRGLAYEPRRARRHWVVRSLSVALRLERASLISPEL
jgi:hypothetical protein